MKKKILSPLLLISSIFVTFIGMPTAFAKEECVSIKGAAKYINHLDNCAKLASEFDQESCNLDAAKYLVDNESTDREIDSHGSCLYPIHGGYMSQDLCESRFTQTRVTDAIDKNKPHIQGTFTEEIPICVWLHLPS